MDRRYQVFDVFTDEALAGNPLAVVLDAEDLDTAAMQAIAREFNLSETVFVLPARNPVHSARLRIFTPVDELPFAGHPTVGAAICLAHERFAGVEELDAILVLEEEVGAIRCGVTVRKGAGVAEFDCPRLPERSAAPAAREYAALALSLAPAEIGFENHVASCWTAGAPFHFIPVANLGVLAKAVANAGAWREAFGAGAAFLYTRETRGYDHAFAARMFAPHLGIPEDPATGSAVAAFAGVIQDFDAMPDGVHSAVIEQGFEMGRPSLIRLEMTVARGALSVVRIGGSAVRVMSGTIHV